MEQILSQEDIAKILEGMSKKLSKEELNEIKDLIEQIRNSGFKNVGQPKQILSAEEINKILTGISGGAEPDTIKNTVINLQQTLNKTLS
jgi:flagellar motor switch protein FliM